MDPLDAAIVLAFVAYALRTGVQNRRQASRGLEEYFLAGRSLSGTQAGLSMAATQFSADTPLLVTGLMATAGIFSLWRLWIYALSFLLLGFVLAPAWRRARVLTDAELSEVRYGGRHAPALRTVKAIYFGLVFNTAVLSMVLFAARRITEPFLPWHRWLPPPLFDALTRILEPLAGALGPDALPGATDGLISLVLILGVAAGYSTSGGLRAVVRTDMVQLALALGGSVAYAVIAVRSAGGLASLRDRLGEALEHAHAPLDVDAMLAFDPSRAADATLPVLAMLGLQWLLQVNADGTGYLAQRCMACRSDRDATRAMLVFSVTQVLLRSLIWIPTGLALWIVLPPEAGLTDAALTRDREASFVTGMDALLPVGARGVLLTAMLAALASTLDTHLNWGASYVTNDLYAPLATRLGRAPAPRRLVRVARLTNVGLVFASLLLMSMLDSIQHAWHVSLLLGAGMGVPLLLRWFWWRVTALAELCAIATSIVCAPLLLALLDAPDAEPLRLLTMAAAGSAATLAVSLWGPPEDPARLQAFYARVRPPGFWKPQAIAAGEPPRTAPRRLLWGLSGAAASALSLFCTLVASGTWLFSGSLPRGIESRTGWIVSLSLTAAAAAGIALHAARKRRALDRCDAICDNP